MICHISLSQFLSVFHKDVLVGWKEIGKEQVLQVLRAGMAMALYCQDDERLYHIICWVFTNRKVFIGYLNGDIYMQKILEAWRRKYSTAQMMSVLSR